MTSSGRRPPPALSVLAQRAAASLAVLAVTGGVVGLATFGTFDSATDTVTRSVQQAPGR